MSTSSTDRIDQLALVWLMVPRAKSDVSGLSAQLKRCATPQDDHKQLARESIARLRDRGMIKPTSPLELTEPGRRGALDALGLAIPPPQSTLQSLKRALFLRSIGAEPTSAAIARAGAADVIAARILIRQHKLDRKIERFASDPIHHKQLASRVVAALARRALGLEQRATPLTLNEAFSAVFLLGHSPTPIDEASANGHNGHSGPASGTMLLRLEDCDLPEFAQRVMDAARSAETRRWHGAVFISQVWSTLQARGELGTTFEKFKRRLIEAHQEKLIELSRADLVDAMPTADVTASETVHSGARFHFVRLEQLAS